jgi:hypothetical protein
VDLTNTETVAALDFDGTPQPTGAYSASSVPLGATITNASFSGSGTLIVGPSANNYALWANDPLKGNIPGEPAGGDFDNDGITNIVEYALGNNPRISSQPAGVLLGNVITYTKGADAIANNDVSWTIETSETLLSGSWTDAVIQANTNNDPDISYTFTPGTPPKKFARLKVTQLP